MDSLPLTESIQPLKFDLIKSDNSTTLFNQSINHHLILLDPFN